MAKQIRVAWNNPSNTANLDHIEIWRKTGVAGTFEKLGSNITTITASTPLTYVDNNGGLGLADSQEYFYDVRTYNDAGGFTSVQSSVTISANAIAAPTSLAAGTPTTTTLPLTWTKSVTGVMTSYRVYRNGVLLQTFTGDVASGTLTGLTSGTSYVLTVRAYNGTNESPDSNTITVSTATDTTAPTAIWAYVPDSNPSAIIVKFSEVVNCASPSYVNRNSPSSVVATAVSGSGTDTLTFTFATAITVDQLGLQISFNAGHVVQDLAGNLLAITTVNVSNMIIGTGTELLTAGAHSRVDETNSIAMFTASNATVTVETVDVIEGLYAAKITTTATGTSPTRGILLVNASNAKKYKTVCWAKKVGGSVSATLSALDGSVSPSVTSIPNDGIWRPCSYYSNFPTTNTASNLRLNVGSGTVTAGSYLLIDKMSMKEYT